MRDHQYFESFENPVCCSEHFFLRSARHSGKFLHIVCTLLPFLKHLNNDKTNKIICFIFCYTFYKAISLSFFLRNNAFIKTTYLICKYVRISRRRRTYIRTNGGCRLSFFSRLLLKIAHAETPAVSFSDS